MKGKVVVVLLAMLGSPLTWAAQTSAAAAALTAEQIVAKHVAARGGAAAWQAVQSLSVSGKLDVGTGDSIARSLKASGFGDTHTRRAEAAAAGGKSQPAEEKQIQIPFRLEMKRPHKSRMEIDFAGTTAVQVYNGTTGWKLRPFLNRNDVEPFSAEEAKASASLGDMEGPLFDYAAKGTKVALEGVESVRGRDAYKLKLTLKDGSTRQIWIDTQSFLDTKIQGVSRRMDGRMHNVYVYQSDFRPTQGVTLPFAFDTAVDGYRETHRMAIEKATVNAALDEARFEKPRPQTAAAAATPGGGSTASRGTSLGTAPVIAGK